MFWWGQFAPLWYDFHFVRFEWKVLTIIKWRNKRKHWVETRPKDFFTLWFRFCLAFKDLGSIEDSETFITGSSIHDGFNVGIGVYGTDNLTIADNVVHFTVGPCIDLQGENNKLVHNLASRSVAESTYKVTFGSFHKLS